MDKQKNDSNPKKRPAKETIDQKKENKKNKRVKSSPSSSSQKIQRSEVTFGGKHLSVDERIKQLLAFKKENGHLKVPKRYNEYNNLGGYVSCQRMQYKKYQEEKKKEKPNKNIINDFNNDKFSRLNNIGFVWELNPWEEHFEELKKYKEINEGFEGVYKNSSKELKSFLKHIRSDREFMSLSDNLRQDRIEKLKSIGFDRKNNYLCTQPPKIGKAMIPFDTRLDNVEQYKKKYGDCHIPESCKEFDNIGSWLQYQRRLYRQLNGMAKISVKTSKMSEKTKQTKQQQFDQLTSIGIKWDPKSAKWEESFAELVKYKQEHGNLNILQSHPTLGLFVQQARSLKQPKGADVTEDVRAYRINKLTGIGFNFDGVDNYRKMREVKDNDVFETMCKDIEAYCEKHETIIGISMKHESSNGMMTHNFARKMRHLKRESLRTGRTSGKMEAWFERLEQIKGWKWILDVPTRMSDEEVEIELERAKKELKEIRSTQDRDVDEWADEPALDSLLEEVQQELAKVQAETQEAEKEEIDRLEKKRKAEEENEKEEEKKTEV